MSPATKCRQDGRQNVAAGGDVIIVARRQRRQFVAGVDEPLAAEYTFLSVSLPGLANKDVHVHSLSVSF